MNLLHMLGRASGVIGALLCLVGAAVRLKGAYWLGGLQVGTLLQAGIAAMVFGCFCLLAFLTAKKS